jgi:nicotinate-nucleotide--dimethylbenzimidazole phosphoribosyltransferase
MTRAQATQSILAGAQVVDDLAEHGMNILATGDMGIGNTTPSTAIAAAFTGLPVLEISGRGTGVDDSGLKRKVEAIQNALEVNQPDDQDGLDVLSKIGGFEIGGIAGGILSAASHKIPVVIDGIIPTAAAMIAVSMVPRVREFLIAAHISQEPGHHHMLEWLRIKPLFDLQMRLGEGTGAALAISMVEAACKILNEMATFDEAGVSKKKTDHDD